jgi:hypothetical protein
MATTITKLFPTGVLQSTVVLDEITYSSIKINLNGIYAAQFDEVSLAAGTAERKTSTGTYLVSGYFDEYTLVPIITIPYDPYIKFVVLLLQGDVPVTPSVSDASTNTFVMSIAGDVKPNNFNPYQNGYYSNYFNGSNYIALGTAASTAVNALSSKPLVTMEFWVNTQAIQAVTAYITTIFGQLPAAAQNSRYLIELVGSSTTSPQTVSFTWTTGTGSTDAVVTTGTIIQKTWNHIAITLDMTTPSSTTIKIYINGVGETFTGKNLSTHSADNGNATYLGAGNGGNQGLTGYISNFRFSKALMYTANFTPSTTPLTANTTTVLLTCQSPNFVDASLNVYTITPTSGPTIQSYVPFVTPSAVNIPTLYSTRFPGTTNSLTTPTSTAFNIGAGDFTIEGWWNFSVLPSGGVNCNLFGFYGGTNYNPYLYIWGDGTYMLRAAQVSGDIATGAHGMVAGTWYHIAVTRSGNTYTIYKNGAVLGTGTSASIVNENKYIIFGDGGSYLNGLMSNLRVVKGLAVYTGAFTPPTSPLTLTQPSGTNIAAITNQTSLLIAQTSNIVDASTNNFAITVTGAVQPVAVTPFTQTYSSQAVTTLGSSYFDGTGDYLTVPSSSAFAFGTGDFTIEGWFNFTGTISTYQRPWWFGDDNENLEINSSVIRFGGASLTVITGPTAVANTWYHIAYSRQSGSGRLFVNGVQAGSTTSNTYNSSARTFTLMATSGGVNPSTGYVADVRIIKGTALYTANFAPPTAPLTAVTNTQLLTLQYNGASNNNGFVDSSANNFILTRVGTPTQGSFAPFGNNWSTYFNGTSGFQTPASSLTSIIGNSTLITSTFTIEAWIYHTVRSGSTDGALVGDMMPAGGTNNWSWGPRNDGKLNFNWYTGATNNCTGSSTIPLNTWTHIALVIITTSIKMFVNGSLETLSGTTTLTAPSSNLGYLGVGMWNSGASGNTNFTGYVSNMLITKSALYSTSFTPNTTPLTATTNTGLLVCQSPSLIDNSPYAFAPTISGTPQVYRFSPFSSYSITPTSYATKFNGGTNQLSIPYNSALSVSGTSWTIEAFIYVTATTAAYTQWIIGNRNQASGYNFSWAFGLNGTTPYLNFIDSGGTNYISSTTACPLNQWVHVAATYNGTSLSMYQNGSRVYGPTAMSFTDYTYPLTIGNYPVDTPYFQGYISNLRMVKGSPIYTGTTYTVPTSVLTAVAGTSLLTCQDSTFKDNSTSTFAITSVSTPAPKQFNPFGFSTSNTQTYSTSVLGGSMYFNGSTDSVNPPTTTNVNPGSGNFTIELWAYHTNAGAYAGYYWGGNAGLVIRRTSSNTLELSHDGVTSIVVSTVTITANQWVHIAATRSGTAVQIFINGVSVGSTTYATAINGTTSPTIGSISTVGGYYMAGYISNFRLIIGTALYTSNFLPPTTPVTAITNTQLLVNGTNSGIYDGSTNSTIQTVGNTMVSNSQVKYGNGSMYFDGSTGYLTSLTSPAFTFGTGDFTIECWIYTTTVSPAQQGIIDFRTSNNGKLALILLTSTLYFQLTTGNITTAASTITINTWTHIAVVKLGTTVTVYVNGVSKGSATDTGSYAAADRVTVGNTQDNYYFNGYIDDLRITKGYARYTTAFTPPTALLPAQ